MIRRDQLSAPMSVFLNLTNRCNLRCRHCSASAGAALDDELTTGEWLALIQRLSELKVFQVTITGGEPLVRPDLFQLVETLDRHRIVSRINTNATLVDDAVAARLAELRFLKMITVSLDGSSPAVHDRLRGRGAFDKAVRGVEALLSHDLNVGLSAVVTRLNRHDLEAMVRLAQQQGVHSISFNSLNPAGRTQQSMETLWLSAEERKEIAERLTSLKEGYGDYVGSTFLNWHRLLTAPPGPGSEPRHIHICGAAQESCAIRANGAVLACNLASEYVCGNIRDEDLASIWQHSPQMQAVRQLPHLTSADVEGCRECAYRFVCTTGCRADAWCMTGSWTGGPTAICWYYPDETRGNRCHQ
jgi:SynChlorMet cassette radical SAM/SPASM protein ScmE